MADTTRKFLDYAGLEQYDELIKVVISTGDEAVKSSLTDGSITVKNATNAGSATKATQDASGNVITTTYETKADATAKLAEAKGYADTIKSDLLNGAGAAYDTLKELGDLIDDNTDAIDALELVASGKADASHTHTVSEISDLTATATELNYMDGVTSNVQTQLDGKASSSHAHGNITNAGAIGTASGKAVITTTNGVLTTGTVPITSGGTGATTAAGALTNLGLTATAAELNIMDGVTATAAEINKLDGLTATTIELNYVGGVTSNIQAQLDGKAASSHTHNSATISAAGFMSAADKEKLDGIAEGATAITVDSTLSNSSTNPVQNKAVYASIDTATQAISANTASISSHTTAISTLQEAVDELQEITSTEIAALFE